jgi:predicted peptidase
MTDSRAIPLILAVAIALASGCAAALLPRASGGPQLARETVGTRYLVHLPAAYETRSDWPVILFLHGAGERGRDLELVKREGLPRILDTLPDFPFVVVSPQEEKDRLWTAGSLSSLLDAVIRTYRVDARRIFATGLSTGATSALDLAISRPGRIAAVAAVSPTRSPANLCGMKSVPVWIFQNDGDDRVPPARSKKLARDLEQCAGASEVNLTFYPSDGHDAWTETYRRTDLYEWFLKLGSEPP